MDLSFAELPQWAGIALAAGIAAVIGALVGMWIARGRSDGRDHIAPAVAENEDLRLDRDNPVFISLQEMLRAKGISAKEQDTRLREFATEYTVIHRKLRELLPVGDGQDNAQRQALAALENGEFEKAITLTEKLGAQEGEEGRS